MKFGFNRPSGFCGYVKNCKHVKLLGQRSNTDLDLLYSKIYIFSIRQVYLPIFSPKLSLKSYVQSFPHISPYLSLP